MIDTHIFSATLYLLGRDPKRKKEKMNALDENKCSGCFSYHRDCVCEYPTLEEMFNKLKETAPLGWVVSDEYHFIGVNHSALTQEQFISFGDVNECFGFNDENANTVCGDMEGITNPDEIAKEFWSQLSEFYPELFKEIN
jgi:hypothetical protein